MRNKSSKWNNDGATSGLDESGVGGNGPNNFCDNSISLVLSDLCVPGRNPIEVRGGIISTKRNFQWDFVPSNKKSNEKPNLELLQQ